MKWILIISVLFFRCIGLAQDHQWKAPESSDELTNPIAVTDSILLLGKKVYHAHCSSCHGAKGRGDGIGGIALQKAPTDFRNPLMMSQTDGNLYWKIATGKMPMQAYKDVLSDEAIWSVIHYLKLLSEDKKR